MSEIKLDKTEKKPSFIKKNWKYILTGVLALFIGSSIGPSDEELQAAYAKIEKLGNQNEELHKTIEGVREENKELAAKVEEAAPYFEMSEQERENQKKEAELKAAELEKQKKEAEEKAAKEEAAKKEAEEKAAKEKAAAEKAARNKTFTAGKYLVGRDIEPGLYDAKALAGQGNFIVLGGYTGLKVNEMFGLGEFYNDAFNNLELEDGDEIEINNDLKIQFIAK
ncbi:hypothetical protein [Cytobacillus oceanisediminis]|uniref:hypothetical protein n=1 Tax=Cytobacillus oceanisediminis TaxID=665099 RepID=UPI001FB3CE46|nr:hypothetical protein [Cytobacillus oceanisediminis]UOE58118.1 hypothetical protein IRB79_26790 [Cytobacillus oceanisediminis]